MKQTLLTFAFMLLPMLASADAVEIDGIYYNLVTKVKQAEVTSNPNKYSGNVSIPESVKYDGVDYSVTSIGERAFEYCSGLTSISIPNSVTSIGQSAFFWCGGLISISIPNSVTSIGNSAFSGCKGLTSITIPNSVTSIGQSAFASCSSLTSITIPNSVTSIGDDAFSRCTGLTSITIPNSVTSIGYWAFQYCSGLTSVTIPNSVTSIGYEAFYGCSGLTSVTIGNSVTSIGYEAFYGCSGLTSVTIGSGIKAIGTSSFASCPELTDVYCYADNVPSTKSDTFNDSYIEYCTLHVPTASISKYQAAEPWKNFKSIVGVDGTLPDNPMQKCATPTISFTNGELEFSCETEGVEYVSEITVGDAKKNYSNKVSLTGIYKVSVYATKAGYDNSDIATKEIQISSGSGTGKVGDLTGDGNVNAADVVKLVNIITGK
jgi:hypothetical protein